MTEFEIIKQYFQSGISGQGVVLGIGDDCALLQSQPGMLQAVSMDTLVAGVHFPANADSELIGQRALRVNLSDLAACGAEARWFTLGLTLPEPDLPWLQGFSQGLMKAASEYNISLVGGDTTRGPLSITIQVHGEVAPGKALRRDQASGHDNIYVTGKLGDAAAAVAMFDRDISPSQDDSEYFLQRYYQPTPRLKEIHQLASWVSAAIDISDGLVADLGHICERSDIAAVLELEKLPLSDALKRSCAAMQSLQLATSGGDDYELCLLVEETASSQFEAAAAANHIGVTCIGHTRAGSGVECTFRGKPFPINTQGYRHF